MPDKNLGRARVLITDDEPQVRSLLRELLSGDYDCCEADSGEEALVLLGRDRFNLILTDIQMGGISGLELIPRVLELAPEAVVVMLSAEQTIEKAISAMRAGAFDYITKPFDLDHVEAAVRRALEHQALLASKRRYETYLENLIEQRTAQVNHLSTHDALTQLPNRALFNDRLTQSLHAAQSDGHALAVVFIDIDRFKRINDTLGPAVGDRLLQEVAARLTVCAREADSVARLGSDEFALLLPRLRRPLEVIMSGQHILDSLRYLFNIENQELYITCSIGISLYPSDGREPYALMQSAGAALHSAKEQGGDILRLFSGEMHAQAAKCLMLENRLRRALERKEFTLHYQPQVTVESGRIVGLEALVRWHSPELGLVTPSEFIALAEETGLIVPLGEWVLRTACLQLKAWHRAGFSSLNMAVNLSPRQFRHHDLLTVIRRALDASELDPQFLELELTESSLIEDATSTAAILGELRAMKVQIAIDDFGTGYSSLSYLKKLPINTLKIDRAFVSDAQSDRAAAAIIEAIVVLGRTLNLKVKAEGVETEEQRAFLSALGCDETQGYLFSKPLPAEEIEPLLLNAKRVEATIFPLSKLTRVLS